MARIVQLFVFISAGLGLAAALVIGFAAPAAGAPGQAPGTSIIVNTLEDEDNSDGDCSLREAIHAANTNAAVDACPAGDGAITDEITFTVSGTITLNAQLLVTGGGPLRIDGGQAITVSGGDSVRVMDVSAGAALTVEKLAIVDGYTDANGGGIHNLGMLTIADSTLSGNTAGLGGGIYNWPPGTLTILNSTLSDNHSELFGGGIINGGTLTIRESTLSGNSSIFSNGGGIVNQGTLLIADSTVSGNSAEEEGGGIENYGTLTIAGSTLSGNSAVFGDGGGIYNAGTLIIADSTLSGNSTVVNSGGGIFNEGTLTIAGSTLSGNSADDDGGGIVNWYDGTVSILNSTLSGNSAGFSGGGIYNFSTLTLTHSTLSDNGATGSGGGIYNDPETGAATANGSIIANSPSGGNCAGNPIADGGYNTDSEDTCGFESSNGSQINTDPLLGPLQDNGGPTWTHALLNGSPAIDTGDPVNCPAVDQRGVPRPQDGDEDEEAICDIGSFEVEGPATGFELFLPLVMR